MQLFPWNRHRSAGLKVCHSACNFLVPSLLHGGISALEAFQERVRQGGALFRRQREGSP